MNDINRLMDLDPLNLSNSDIETIIAYHRAQRGAFDQGQKPKKAESTVDLSSVMKALKASVPEAPPMKRRSLK